MDHIVTEPAGSILHVQLDAPGALAHVPAKWIRFVDKDMRQHGIYGASRSYRITG
jgi:hypothetical protein